MAFSMLFTALPTNTIASLAEETVSIEDCAVQSFDVEDNSADEVLGLNIDAEEVSPQNQLPETQSSQEQSGEFSIDAVTILDDSADSTVMQEDTSDSEEDTITVQEYWYEKYFAVTDSVILEVQAQCSTGNLSYEWQQFDSASKTYQKITNNSTAANAKLELGTLEEGSYQFACKLSDATANSEKYVFFDVYVGQHISVKCLSQRTFSIKPGKEVTLALQASSNLQDDTLTYQWSFTAYNGTMQALSDNRSDSLTVTPSKTGTYSCKIKSTKGKNLSETINFQVSVDSGLSTDEDQVIANGEIGSEVTLRVSAVSASSKALTYQWYHHVKENSKYTLTLINDAGQDTYKPIVSADYTKNYYLCRISDGCNQIECNFYVIPNQKLQVLTTAAERTKTVHPGGTVVLKASACTDSSGNYGTVRYVWDLTPHGKADIAANAIRIKNIQKSGTYTCVVSDKFHTEEISFTVHVIDECRWDEGTITKEPTCTEEGIRVYTCSICQATKEEQISAVGHSCGEEWKIEKEATCAECGRQYRECVNCHERMETAEIPVTNEHTYANGYIVTKAPTALTEGWEVRECSICHKEDGRNVQKLTGTIRLTSKKLKLQVKKSANLSSLVTGLADGDSIQSWKSGNKAVAVIKQNGLVTGKKAGTATITVTLASGTSAEITVVVQKGSVPATKVSIESNKFALAVGKSTTLKPIVTPITSSQKPVFKSLNKKVATVNSKGKVTAKAAGKATILITAGKQSVKVTVTVPKPALKAIKNIPKSKTLKKGQSFTLYPKKSPSGAAAKFTYSSSNRTVATVSSNGKIKAKKKGTAVITVKSGKITASCKVKVK